MLELSPNICMVDWFWHTSTVPTEYILLATATWKFVPTMYFFQSKMQNNRNTAQNHFSVRLKYNANNYAKHIAICKLNVFCRYSTDMSEPIHYGKRVIMFDESSSIY